MPRSAASKSVRSTSSRTTRPSAGSTRASLRASRKPPDPEPEPEPEPDPEPEPEPIPAEEGDEELAAEAKRLLEEGGSQRSIADQMGISRDKVRRLLAA